MAEESQSLHCLYRPRNILLGILALFIAIVGWMVWEVWLVYTAKPNPATNYRVVFRQEIERATGVAPAAADESWTLFVEAVSQSNRIIAEASERNRHRDFVKRDEVDNGDVDFAWLTDDPLPVDIAREEEALDVLRERGVIELLDQFSTRPIGIRPTTVDGPMIGQVLPELSQARTLAKARGASMRLACHGGDEVEVAKAFDHLLAMASTIAHQQTLISGLVGMAIHSLARYEVCRELTERQFGEEACRRMLDSLDRHPMPPLSLMIEGERLVFHDTVQHFFSDEGDGNGYMLPEASEFLNNKTGSFIAAAVSRFYLADRAEAVQTADAYFAQFADDDTESSASGVANSDLTYWNNLPRRLIFVSILLPAIDKCAHQARLDQTFREGLRLLLAVELYRARHGDYPASLDHLAPDVLNQLPKDPIAKAPFGYRRIEQDEHGRGYLLYSFGFDGIDNGGKIPDDAKIPPERAFSRDQAAGFDFVFNLPRPKRERTN